MAPSLAIGRVNNTIAREPLKEIFLTTFDAGRNNLYTTLSMLSREQKSTESVESYLSDLYQLFGNSNYYTEEQKSAVFI